ncbi:FkbM family methyltransferase [Methylobacillus sp. Pita2]|uniref:FkbM family methyltransferase n=1 Tax=Methylobacillus sp. Pita2 TaxID=3383245 RepID=UPI0038B56DB3
MHRSLIKLTTKRGKILNAFEGDSITREIQHKGEYDSNILDSLTDVLAVIRPETSLDIGANIGNHTLVIADYSRRLIAFEPVDFIFQALTINIEQNHAKHAEAVNAGLSNLAQEVDIFIPDNANLGSSSLEIMESSGQKLKISTLVGDDYLAQQEVKQVDFIKMDVEGHEVPALQGLKHTIQIQQPLLLLEYKNQKTIDGFIGNDLFNTLFSGYTIFSITVTNSKKVHGKGMCGFIKRFYYKYFDKRWVLSGFSPEKKYSNIYLVPERYLSKFQGYPFMPHFAK